MNFSSLATTLPIMAKGMAGILMVSAVIIAVTILLGKLFKEEEDTKES